MVKSVYNHYGPYGIYRGFSAPYFSATSAGYAFFLFYKGIKVNLREKLNPKTQY